MTCRRSLLGAAAAAALIACSSPPVANPRPGSGGNAEEATPTYWQPVVIASDAPHSAPISSLVVARDGESAVTIDQLGYIRIWPALTKGREPINPMIRGVADAAIARASGERLIAALIDTSGALRILSVNATREVREVHSGGPDNVVIDVQVLARSGLTVALRRDRSIDVFDPAGRLIGHYDERGFNAIRLYVSGQRIAALDGSASDNAIRLHVLDLSLAGNAATLTPVKIHELPVDGDITDISASALGPDGARFAIASAMHETGIASAHVFDLERGTRVSSELGAGLVPAALGFVDAATVLALVGTTGASFAIRVDTGAATSLPIWGQRGGARAVADGRVVSVAAGGLHVATTKAKGGDWFLGYRAFTPTTNAISPSGRYLFFIGPDHFDLLDRTEGTLFESRRHEEGFLFVLAFFADEDTLVLVGTEGQVRLIDRESGAVLSEKAGGGGFSTSSFDPIGQKLIVTPRYGEFWLYEIEGRSLRGPYAVSDGGSRSGLLTGEYAAWTLDSFNVLRIYSLAELRDGVVLSSIAKRGARLNNFVVLDVAPDLEIFALHYDGNQRLIPTRFAADRLDARSALLPENHDNLKRQLQIEPGSKPKRMIEIWSAAAIALSPDGKWFAVSSPSSVTLYDRAAMRIQWSYPLPNQPSELAWNGTSRFLSARDGSGVVVIDVETGKAANSICSRIFTPRTDSSYRVLTTFQVGSVCVQ